MSPAAESTDQRLDVVYTWVDGTWPGYAELTNEYAEVPLDLNPNRFRDNIDILRYSLRSLERYAPWLGRLFLVTMRPQLPAWLDTKAPELHVVHHDEIFEPEYLPSFNSLAIVSHLHRIPDVSDRFLYFEDDTLLGRPTSVADFIDAQGRARFWETLTTEDNAWRHDDPKLSLWASVLARSNHLLNERQGWRWHGSFHSAPTLIDKARFGAMIEEYADAFHQTRASPFRTRGNAAAEHMFPYYLRHLGQGVFVPKSEVYGAAAYAGLDNSLLMTRIRLARLRLQSPKFYCLNDNYGDSPDPKSVARARHFLEKRYPEPSRFELG
jgi:hypothetical protein